MKVINMIVESITRRIKDTVQLCLRPTQKVYLYVANNSPSNIIENIISIILGLLILYVPYFVVYNYLPPIFTIISLFVFFPALIVFWPFLIDFTYKKVCPRKKAIYRQMLYIISLVFFTFCVLSLISSYLSKFGNTIFWFLFIYSFVLTYLGTKSISNLGYLQAAIVLLISSALSVGAYSFIIIMLFRFPGFLESGWLRGLP
jgi:hypothetical protein